MLLKKLFRTILRYKAQFISMIIMIILGVGVFVGFQGEWYSIKKDTYSFYDETGFADYDLIDEDGYSIEDYNKIISINGISKASRFLKVNTNEEKENDIISLTVAENIEVSGFIVTKGEEYNSNSTDGIWMSDQYAKANNYNIGDSITLKYNSISLTGNILGLIKSSEYLICLPDENQLMPNYNTCGYVYISPSMLTNVLGYEYYTQINVISNLSKSDFSNKVDEALERTNLIVSKDEKVSFSEAQGEVTEGKTMASILPVIFLGIALLIMVTTMQRLTQNEKTQIGTLKALGFRNRRIAIHYTSYGLFIGIIGSIVGILFGYFIAWFIFNPNGSMGTYFDLPSWKIYVPWYTFVIVLLVVVLLTFVSYITTRNILRGSGAETLKPYTPKAMKRHKIEDSTRWRKLKFSTKWNLRDIFRHKSRSFMTLFGIFGCSVLLVASFLSMDSMKGFVNKFYTSSMNYKSMITISTDDNDLSREIAQYYDCDYAATSTISFNDEALSMEIYNIDNGYVKFLDKKTNYVNLNSSGVYIGQRLKKEANLKIGDTIEVKLFGTNISYNFIVAGELRTLTKGIVLTEEYAIDNGVDYKINKLYSNKNVSEIKADNLYSEYISAIKSKNDVVKSFDSFLNVMYTMIGALIVLSIILGIVVLYNLGVMSYFERYRELSTLKVVGFKDKRIGKLLIEQNMWLTILGLIIGFPCGILITKVILTALASEYEMMLIFGWMTYVIPPVLVILTSLIVSLFVAKKSKTINMVEALKVPE